MTETRGSKGVGQRIQAARRDRGFRTARELADAIDAPNVTLATIENLESGRRVDVSVSQLLNIAMALKIPPVMLLAAVDEADGQLDLPDLSAAFDGMTSAVFDAWVAGLPDGAYREPSEYGRSDRAKLNASRELQTLLRERDRLSVASELGPDDVVGAGRIRSVDDQIASVRAYLSSVGWRSRGGSN